MLRKGSNPGEKKSESSSEKNSPKRNLAIRNFSPQSILEEALPEFEKTGSGFFNKKR